MESNEIRKLGARYAVDRAHCVTVRTLHPSAVQYICRCCCTGSKPVLKELNVHSRDSWRTNISV